MALVNIGWYLGCFQGLMHQPMGIYGISYDIYTRPTEDPIPHGWDSHRSQTYRELIKRLRAQGYNHHQYSDHRKLRTTALNTFAAMVSLTRISPPSKLSTTVKGLKLHYISDMNICDVSNQVRLGGNAARRLAGPAPRGLVNGVWHNLSQAPQPVPQGHPGVPPKYTAVNVPSQNVLNYWM